MLGEGAYSMTTPKKEKKKAITIRLAALKDRIIHLSDAISRGEKAYHTAVVKAVNLIKVFIVSTRKFMMDDCLTKASSIAYTVIISLIPTLTVILTVYTGTESAQSQKERLFAKIQLFMLEHNIKLNIDFIISAISGMIDNAGKVGIIGGVFLIFSATALLRSLEKSFNDIWKTERQRPLYLKLIYYWAALTLGPLLLVVGTTAATIVSEVLSSPNYQSAFISKDKGVWVVGNKSTILHAKDQKLSFMKLDTDTIDFDNQKIFGYDGREKKFIQRDDRIEPIVFKKKKFTDIQFIGKKGWIIGRDGIILSTSDNGSTWQLNQFGDGNLNAIRMIDEDRGFIAADTGRILHTTNGGRDWKMLEWNDINVNFTSIAFHKNNGIITGKSGYIAVTKDSGATWEPRRLEIAKRKNLYVDLNACQFTGKEKIWIAGSEGILITSKDGGETWEQKKFMERDYYALYFFDAQKGFVAGDRGLIIGTEDGGENWQKAELPTYRINRLFFDKGRLWAVGDNGMIMQGSGQMKSWKGREGKSFLVIAINFLTPFIFIWLVFFLAYISLPNTKVALTKAAIGAAFTGTVWVTFIFSFNIYIKGFADSTFAVYGALAAIPLFLLLVYASSVIILYGAEVAYTLMHPETYERLKRIFIKHDAIQVYYGISLLHAVYKKFESGKGPSAYNELIKTGGCGSEQADFFLSLFVREKLIMQSGDTEYLPSTNSKSILLADVMETISRFSLEVPGPLRGDELKGVCTKLFNDIRAGQRKIIGGMSLGDLIRG